MRKILNLFLCFLLCILNLSYPAQAAPIQKTQLEIREMQTRVYDIKDKNIVLKSIINTLQDEGYNIEKSNDELGLLTGIREFQIPKTKLAKGLIVFGWMLYAGATFGIGLPISIAMIHQEFRAANATLYVTVNASQYGKQYKIRATFLKKIVDPNTKRLKYCSNVEDERFYQAFFAEIDKSIFVQKENI